MRYFDINLNCSLISSEDFLIFVKIRFLTLFSSIKIALPSYKWSSVAKCFISSECYCDKLYNTPTRQNICLFYYRIFKYLTIQSDCFLLSQLSTLWFLTKQFPFYSKSISIPFLSTKHQPCVLEAASVAVMKCSFLPINQPKAEMLYHALLDA